MRRKRAFTHMSYPCGHARSVGRDSHPLQSTQYQSSERCYGERRITVLICASKEPLGSPGEMLQTAFAFRIVIGALFIVEYFVGFDGHGLGAGRPLTLVFGIAFIAYGIIGSVQRASLRKRVLQRRAASNVPGASSNP